MAAEDALDLGLDVWLSPELWNHTPERTLAYLAEAARHAETIRTAAGVGASASAAAAPMAGRRERVVLSVATEASFFLRGILPGRTFAARTKNPAAAIRAGRHVEPLAKFLADAAAVARREFGGPISYASLPFERVDWGLFDFVGVDHYRYVTSEPHYERILERHLRHGKPLVITEFGMRAYRGAELDPDLLTTGLISWPTVALSARRVPFIRPRLQTGKAARLQTGEPTHPQSSETTHPQAGKATRPQASKGPLRDEALQARRVAEDLAIFERMRVAGAFVTQFDEPLLTHDADPRFDLDMSGFSLVTTPQRKKKEAFHAVAHHYAGGPGRLGVPFSQP
ncbi:hypothetical protein ACQP00_35220 [Dactylosporangium sp. CS-047395]|uniref:hypothetical protein n=1 Tax=Dactylosporangium sp. CS-047395 TaxID=3239936 RepID=UPI003D8D617D